MSAGAIGEEFRTVFGSLAFAKVYSSKKPITALDLLYDGVLPSHEELRVR